MPGVYRIYGIASPPGQKGIPQLGCGAFSGRNESLLTAYLC